MSHDDQTTEKALAIGCSSLLLCIAGPTALVYLLTDPHAEQGLKRLFHSGIGFLVGSFVGAFVSWRVARWVDTPKS